MSYLQLPFQTVALANGTRVRVRPIRGDDAPRLQAFVTRLSPRTLFLRTNMVRAAALSDQEAAYLTNVDYRSSVALVALAGKEPRDQIVGVARYAGSQTSLRQAEAAVVVEDAYQGLGLGSQLLVRLAAYAREQRFTSLVGNISAENEAVLSAIRRTGLAADYADVGYGECQVVVSLNQRPARSRVAATTRTKAGRPFQWPWALIPRFAPLFRSR